MRGSANVLDSCSRLRACKSGQLVGRHGGSAMTRSWMLVLALLVSWWAEPTSVQAQNCFLGCTQQAKACVTASRLAKKACVQECRSTGAGPDRRSCLESCRQGFRQARGNCRAEASGCTTTCIPALVPVPTECLRQCGGQLADCARQVAADARQCAEGCNAAADRPACLRSCAESAATGGSACSTAFHACLDQCRGTVPPGGCRCGEPCTNELGVEGVCLPAPTDPLRGCRCMVPPCRVGQCLDVATGSCTGEACGPGQPCIGGQVCDFLAVKCPCREGQPCTTDADCDDGRNCTVDRCGENGCTHDCLCVGLFACGPWGF